MAELGVSTVTEGELSYGLARRPSAPLQATIETFLLGLTIFPWDSSAAQSYGDLRSALERQGQLLGSLDMMIAAHALSLRLILVSGDTAFKRIKHLKVEDWTK
jgi:tRNA(fMet)-specific endonuclease VapC